jgi:two-component system, NarL family, sensor histidine kinase UhpB
MRLNRPNGRTLSKIFNFRLAASVVVLGFIFWGLIAISNVSTNNLHVVTPLCSPEIPTDSTRSNDLVRQSCRFQIPNLDGFLIGSTGEIDTQSGFAFLIPYFRDTILVSVNGLFITEASNTTYRLPLKTSVAPTLVFIPGTAVVSLGNSAEFVVNSTTLNPPVIGDVYIGGAEIATREFQLLWLKEVIIPALVLGSQLSVATIFLIVWLSRRSEKEFGWLAFVLLLDMPRGLSIIPAFGYGTDALFYSSLLIPFSSAAYVLFARSITRASANPRFMAIWILPIMILVSALFIEREVADDLLWVLGAVTLAVNLAVAIWVLLSRFDEALIFEIPLPLLCTIFVFTALIYDISAVMLGRELSAISRPSLLILLATMILLVVWRYNDAVRKISDHAFELEAQKHKIESDLANAYQVISLSRERILVAEERSRLMRDLHDGLGGEMIALLALAENNKACGESIARHARTALDDMRLIIASLEDYGGDLSFALGTWKERAESQILASGIFLHWSTGDIPEISDTSPKIVLNILRILQEALVNALKHANATELFFSAKQLDCSIVLTLRDNGVGISMGRRLGRGINNMHSRAEAINGRLEIISSAQGTSVTIFVPIKE